MTDSDIPPLEEAELFIDGENLKLGWTKASVAARLAFLRELNEKLGIHLVGLELSMGDTLLSHETDLIYAKRLQTQIYEVLSHE